MPKKRLDSLDKSEVAPRDRQRQKALQKRVLLRAPKVAWPSVALAVAIGVSFPMAIALGVWGLVSTFAAGLISFLSLYAAFTLMHEASHRALGRSRMLNAVVGRAAALVLTGTFPAFRVLHLLHHQETNDPERDPDAYVAEGPWFLLPLRWATVDVHDWFVYCESKLWKSRPVLERIEVMATGALLLVIMGICVALGVGKEMLCLWLLPARLAVLVLTFGFDYLPHWPHEARVREDRFRSARILASPWLTPLLFGHNYHLIHHLYPAVPFHRYGALFRVLRPELEAKGARIQGDRHGGREGLRPLRPAKA